MPTIESRKRPDGAISYRAKVRLKGHLIQSATFDRRTDARKWAQSTEAAIREGRYFKTAEAKRRTVGEMIDRYVREVLPRKPKNARNTAAQLEWWKAQLGPRLLADVTAPAIAECRDRLLSEPYVKGKEKVKRSPATVLRYMAALSHTFTIAVRDWGWLDDSPMRKVSKPKQPQGRVRFLNNDERGRLLRACEGSPSPYLYDIVVLALATGMRLGEIRALRWPDIDLKRGWITIRQAKNGERRGVPLVGYTLEQIRARANVRRIDTDLLFPGTKRDRPIDITRAWRQAIEAAQIPDFRFHDLRHCAASYLAMNGASAVEIAQVLGHKTLQMVKRYAHLSNDHTTQIVSKMNATIFAKEREPNASSAA